MLALLLTLSTIGLASDYVQDYQAQPGDRVVLAEDEKNASVPVTTDYSTFEVYRKHLRANDMIGVAKLMDSGRAEALEGETPALFVKMHEHSEGALAEVRLQDGPHKDKLVWVQYGHCRKLKPEVAEARERAARDAKAWAEAKAKRGTLNAKVIADEPRRAITKAKADASKMGTYRAAQNKERIMREAIDRVRRRHVAEMDELVAIAKAENVFINFDGQKYDVAGNKIK